MNALRYVPALTLAAALASPGTGAAPATVAPAAGAYATVVPGGELRFPDDYGSHPEFRTEWWYVTGWLDTARGEALGFQITFFRTRPTAADANPSKFAARQLIIAHCAVSDPARGRLWQDQRIRRAGLGLADAAVGNTQVFIGDWRFERGGDGVYHATLQGENFSLQLEFDPTQPPLLNGEHGFSRKGPEPRSASYYYSIPHLGVRGTVTRHGQPVATHGEAWLDHEWSSEYLDAQAVGWDWIGVNLADGGALMAFRIRDAAGGARWMGGSLREAGGNVQPLDHTSLTLEPQRWWRSPHTAVSYPVQWRLRAGTRAFQLQPLMDDQENDTRLSTGAIYWEGAVRAFERGRPAGRGYLELTGYGTRLNLR